MPDADQHLTYSRRMPDIPLKYEIWRHRVCDLNDRLSLYYEKILKL